MDWRPPFAWIVYPALVAGAFYVLDNASIGLAAALVFAAPSVLTGALVRRTWMYVIPVIGFAAFAVLGDMAGVFDCEPGIWCDDSPGQIAIGTFVLGTGVSLAGLAVGHAAALAAARLRAAASPGS